MITFLSLGLNGRLGNQLFQYAALKSLSIKKNYTIKLPNTENLVWHNQKCLLNKLNIKEEVINDIDMSQLQFKFEEESFNSNFFKLPDNISLNGYFQNINYFIDNLPLFKNLYRSNDIVINETTSKFQEYSKQRKHNNIIGIHIRLGDNITIYPSKIIYEKIMMGDPYITYLKSAIDFFGKDNDYLIFCGGTRDSKTGQDNNDIKLRKEILKNFDCNFIYSVGNDTLIDFELMKMCDNNVLSPISSFSLWIGYLANDNKKIVVPNSYFMNTENHIDMDSIYLKHWNRL